MPGLILHFAPAAGLAHPLPPLIAIGTFDVPWSSPRPPCILSSGLRCLAPPPILGILDACVHSMCAIAYNVPALPVPAVALRFDRVGSVVASSWLCCVCTCCAVRHHAGVARPLVDLFVAPRLVLCGLFVCGVWSVRVRLWCTTCCRVPVSSAVCDAEVRHITLTTDSPARRN